MYTYGSDPPAPTPTPDSAAAGGECASTTCRVGSEGRWGPPKEQPFRRHGPAGYVDGAGAPRASPAPTDVSDRVLGSSRYAENRVGLSGFLAGWSHFASLDLSHIVRDAAAGTIGVPYPTCDDLGNCVTRVYNVTRVKRAAGTGEGGSGPRAPLSSATPVFDGEPVYGYTPDRTAALRTFADGLLKEDPVNGAPLNVDGQPVAGPNNPRAQRLTGAPGGNASPALLAVIGTFVKEHNRIARALKAANPLWEDEVLFQEARVRVVARIQKVHYIEYLPLVLGSPLQPAWKGYDAGLDGRVSGEYSAAGSRYGHSILTQLFLRLDENGTAIPQGHLLPRDVFFNGGYLADTEEGMAPIIRGLAAGPAARVDPNVIDDIRRHTNLFLPDLAVQDIVRGRDMGLPTYKEARRAYGLSVPSTWADITDYVPLQNALQSVYASVDDVDMIVGALCERESPRALVGPLFAAVLAEQYRRARDSDPFWFESLPAPVREEARADRFTNIVLRNWPLVKSLPTSVFIATPPKWPASASGAVAVASPAAAAASNGSAAGLVTAQIGPAISLSWQLLPASKEIEVTMRFTGDGWVGMGLGDAMTDADIVLHRFDPATGKPQLIDLKASGFRTPDVDAQQDVRLVEGSRAGGVNTFRWRRAWETGDAQDKPFRPGPQPLIFAWRPSGYEIVQHNPRDTVRGSLDFWSGAAAGASGGVVTLATGGSMSSNVFVIHALGMGAAWGILVPVSIFAARHLKHLPFWLEFHRATMSVVISVTIPAASAAISLTSSSNGLDPYAGVHGVIGVVAACSVIAQLCGGHLAKHLHGSRAPPRHARLVRVIHRLMGRALAVLAFANMLLGVEMLHPPARPFVAAWIALVALVFVAGELWSLYARRRALPREDNLNAKKVAHLSPQEFDRAVRLGSKWCLMGDRIFDMETFMPSHPGGSALLAEVVGQDISPFLFGSTSLDIAGYGPHHHSHHAHAILQQLCVGQLAHTEHSKIDLSSSPETWTLLDKVPLNASSRPIVRLRFTSSRPVRYGDDLRYCGQHFEVTARVGGKEVHRHYTLARLFRHEYEDESPEVQELWVRRYPKGALSPFLADAPAGTPIRVRGPLGLGLRLDHESSGDLVAVASGTGILPFLDLVAYLRKADAHLESEAAPAVQPLDESPPSDTVAERAAEGAGPTPPDPARRGSDGASSKGGPRPARPAKVAPEPGGHARASRLRTLVEAPEAPLNTALRLKLVATFEALDDVPQLAWLEECHARCPSLDLFLFVRRPPEPAAAWLKERGHFTGRVDAAFLQERVMPSVARLKYFYICGTPRFNLDVREAASGALHVDPNLIVTL